MMEEKLERIRVRLSRQKEDRINQAGRTMVIRGVDVYGKPQVESYTYPQLSPVDLAAYDYFWNKDDNDEWVLYGPEGPIEIEQVDPAIIRIIGRPITGIVCDEE